MLIINVVCVVSGQYNMKNVDEETSTSHSIQPWMGKEE